MEDIIGDAIMANQNVRDEESSTIENHFIIWFKLLNNPYMMVAAPTVSTLLL